MPPKPPAMLIADAGLPFHSLLGFGRDAQSMAFCISWAWASQALLTLSWHVRHRRCTDLCCTARAPCMEVLSTFIGAAMLKLYSGFPNKMASASCTCRRKRSTGAGNLLRGARA